MKQEKPLEKMTLKQLQAEAQKIIEKKRFRMMLSGREEREWLTQFIREYR